MYVAREKWAPLSANVRMRRGRGGYNDAIEQPAPVGEEENDWNHPGSAEGIVRIAEGSSQVEAYARRKTRRE